MVTSASTRPARRRARRAWLAIPLLVAVVAAACGGDDDSGGGGSDGSNSDSSGPITLGYSAWPGWAPWAVTEEAGIFDEVGVDVKLKWFDDYIGSLDAMSAGQIDANSQTLNDTIVGVSAGSPQTVVVVNDNSAGNDAIIVDKSIDSIEDLKGKDVGAEAGVVDHFLLLQGLESVGLSEEDIHFQGLLTADAAASFSGGQLDAVGVFAPFTVQALERPGSKVLFDSSDFPGTIPDFLSVNSQLVKDRPEDVQKLVDAWYKTLDYIQENPEESAQIMADRLGVSVDEYNEFASGTHIFTPDDALASLTGDADTDLPKMTETVNEFLADTDLLEEQPELDSLYDKSFTEDYLERAGK